MEATPLTPGGRPQQQVMQDSLVHAEADSGKGAECENTLTASLGSIYDCICCCCAGAGCSCNMYTVKQGYVGVVTEFGRYKRTLPPGRHRYNIFSEQVKPINLMTICFDVPKQEMMSADNLMVKVDAVCYFNVFDAMKAAFAVENYQFAVSRLIEVTLRTVLGEHTLAEILAERQKLNARIQELLDEGSDPWGIKVNRVEMKQIDIDEAMQRAMAAKTEAHQEAEAKIIQAKAQRDSSVILAEAAKKMEAQPAAMKLQWFETLRVISTQGHNTTVILPDTVEFESKK